jgi:hypothetical protein
MDVEMKAVFGSFRPFTGSPEINGYLNISKKAGSAKYIRSSINLFSGCDDDRSSWFETVAL